MQIELNDVSIGYLSGKGPVTVQHDIDATLHGGEFVCLLGRNGAGKSTMLRTLCGFIPVLKGSIIIDGRTLQSYEPSRLARKIGVVLTERPTVSAMTVRQLVALGRSPYTSFWGRLSDKDRRAVEDAIEMTGIEELCDRQVDTLSDGERQKVMIAKALAQESEAIFLDEPTAFLDFPSKVEVMRLLKKLAQGGKIIFQSTHDLNLALSLSDRIWLVDKHIGFMEGTPADLSDSGDLAACFETPGIRYDSDSRSFTI